MNDIEYLYKKFGFNGPPFSQTSDTDFMFKSKQHMAALDHLKYGLITDGFTLLTGDNGMGKTLLCRQILRTAGKDIQTVYLYNTCLCMLDILKMIYCDLTGNQLEGESSSKCLLEINKVLVRLAEEGKRVVILVDEAQGLKTDLLEGLRQLSNLETEKRKLLSFILIGQPELLTRLASYDLRQLEQRISVKYFLKPFKLTDTMQYIYHRLKISKNSAAGGPYYRFTTFAVCLIHWYSKGIPRRINQICDRALLASFNTGVKGIGTLTIFHAAREITGCKSPRKDKSIRNNIFVRIAAAMIFCGLAAYIGLDMYQDKLSEKRKSLDLNQNYLNTEFTSADLQTVIDKSVQSSVKEKQPFNVLVEGTKEINAILPEPVGRVVTKQTILNPLFSELRTEWDVCEEALDKQSKSDGLPNPDNVFGLNQRPHTAPAADKHNLF